MLNLTVEAGNFSPPTLAPGDSIKTQAFVDFYRRYHYDAVGLSSREVGRGLDFWRRAEARGLPVVAANVFYGKPGKIPALFPIEKPALRQYVIRKDQGRKLGVIGFVSAQAWKARRDTASAVNWRSPMEMGDLVRKVAKQTDWLTVIGEFSQSEADSLVKRFPEIDLVVTSGVRTDQPTKIGHSIIIGSTARGSFANFVELSRTAAGNVEYSHRSQVLDESVPIDSTESDMLTETNNQIKALSAKH